jgi:hypothetical protein
MISMTTFTCHALRLAGAGLLALGLAAPVLAKLSDAEIAQLGKTGTPLTPVGATRAGNQAGTIPEWTGGIQTPPAGFKPGEPWVDPYADDKPLFTITAQNYEQYKDNLLPGQIAMFKQYPETFRMHVYPSHRSAAYPDWFVEATKVQAKSVEMCPEYAAKGELCLINVQPGGGVPFPIPKTAEELGWNSMLGAYRGTTVDAMGDGALIDSLGNRTDVIIRAREYWPYQVPADKKPTNEWFTQWGGAFLCDSWQIEQPPRSSGLVFGGCMYAQNTDFQVYLYIPGQRRVRKAPEIGFHDSPSFGSDGQRTVSSRWMWWFGGKEPRHSYSMQKGKELFIPYNAFKIVDPNLTFNDIYGKKHINQDLIRYELHRVWVMDSQLKPGFRHLYKRHVAYFDEDTWMGVAYEAYDAKDRLWRVGEQYNLNLYDKRMVRIMGDSQIDLVNGRYTTYPYWHVQAGKASGFGMPKFETTDETSVDLTIFTPQGLRKFGTR